MFFSAGALLQPLVLSCNTLRLYITSTEIIIMIALLLLLNLPVIALDGIESVSASSRGLLDSIWIVETDITSTTAMIVDSKSGETKSKFESGPS